MHSKIYCDWVAQEWEQLPIVPDERDIPIPECQQKDLKEFQEQDGIRSAVFWTANDGGLSIWDTEIIEMCFTDDVFFEEYHMEEVEIWDNTDADEKELYEDPENDFFTSEAEFNRICQEKKESLKVPSHIQHADVPYRPIFAKLIKSVHDKQERIQHLKWFYENFNECASK